MKKLLLLLFLIIPSSAFGYTDDEFIFYVNTDSTPGGTGFGPLTTGVNRAYATLGEAIERIKILWPSLVNTKRMTIWVSGTKADTSCPVIENIVSDSYNRLYITTQFKDRHNGVWDNTKYRLEGECDTTLTLNNPYVTVVGLQIGNVASTDKNTKTVKINAGQNTLFRHNLVRFAGTNYTSTSNTGIEITPTNTPGGSWSVQNNIIYGHENGIILNGGTSTGNVYHILNNTVVTNSTGIYGISLNRTSAGTINFKNNLIQGPGINYFVTGTTSALNTATNLTFDSTSPQATLRNKTVIFRAANDYHLAKADVEARDKGTNISDRAYDTTGSYGGGDTVLSDIDDLTRMFPGNLYDIGADEIPTIEICGDEIDNDEDPTTTDLCPGADKDWDGFNYGDDCDDTNYRIYPGISAGCDAGTGTNSGWKTCQPDGSWTTCVSNSVSPLCEKENAGSCYYIDPVNGSDSNPGTFDQPLRTIKRLTTYDYTKLPYPAPTGWLGVRGGDAIYFKSGVYGPEQIAQPGNVNTFFYARYSSASPHLLNLDHGNIRFKNYPGHTPIFSPNPPESMRWGEYYIAGGVLADTTNWTSADWVTNNICSDNCLFRIYPMMTIFHFLSLHSSSTQNKLIVEGLTLKDSYAKGIQSSQSYIIRNNNLTRIGTKTNDNTYAIETAAGARDSIVSHNTISEIFDWPERGPTRGAGGQNALMHWRDRNNTIMYNRLGQTRSHFGNFSNSCIQQKHADRNSSVEVHHNICKNSAAGIELVGPNVDIHHNVSYNAVFRLINIGGTAHHYNYKLHNNTFTGGLDLVAVIEYGANPAGWIFKDGNDSGWYYGEPSTTNTKICNSDASIGPFQIYNNIITRNQAALNGDNDFYTITANGLNTTYNRVRKTTRIDNNCYFNYPTPNFNAGISQEGNLIGHDCTTNNQGTIFKDYTSLSSWQNETGFDMNSFYENPLFDNKYHSTNPNCMDKGAYTVSRPNARTTTKVITPGIR